MIRLVFPVTAQDQRQAANAIARRVPLLRWLPFVLLAVTIVMVAWSMSDGWTFGIALFRNMFWIVMTLLYFFLGVRIATWQAVKAMRKADPDWAEEQTIEFDDAGVRMQSPSSRFEFAWNEVLRVVETPHVWLIHVGTKLAFIPLRVAAAEGVLDQLRSLIESKVGQPIEH